MPAVHGYNVDNEIVRPVVEAARDNGLIVSIHSGPANCHPTRIGKVAGWIPETPVIMDHMGFPDDLDAGIEAAKANKNIYLGTTILRFHQRWEPTRIKSSLTRSDKRSMNWDLSKSYSAPTRPNTDRFRYSMPLAVCSWEKKRKA